MTRLRIGIDVGGTFTDVSVFDETSGRLHVAKTPSTPKDSSVGIAEALQEILTRLQAKGPEVAYLAHGTTVSTNALIMHAGAKTGLITTKGFKDLLEIARQVRPDLYDLQAEKPEALVPRDLRLEVTERVYGDGTELIPLDKEETRKQAALLAQMGVESVAVCLLHSYLKPEHEQEVKAILQQALPPDVFLSISHEVVPEFREYERLSTAVVNAYLGPIIERYISRLEKRIKDLGIERKIYITQSNGGLISTEQTRNNPVRTALSGPSTGVIGGGARRRFVRV